jgi:hypothetical protein
MNKLSKRMRRLLGGGPTSKDLKRYGVPRACRCCGYVTVSHLEPRCAVCWWESDPVQEGDDSFTGGPNEVNLREARENFATIGVSDSRFAALTRRPRSDEIPADRR